MVLRDFSDGSMYVDPLFLTGFLVLVNFFIFLIVGLICNGLHLRYMDKTDDDISVEYVDLNELHLSSFIRKAGRRGWQRVPLIQPSYHPPPADDSQKNKKNKKNLLDLKKKLTEKNDDSTKTDTAAAVGKKSSKSPEVMSKSAET